MQHIALATGDVFSTVERLRRRVDLLPISENYYDDLEARTDLTAEDLIRLRSDNILYDRDGGNEYFQAYTKAMDGGFFFEVVERRKYQGYGVANASIRLAAQSRLATDRVPGL